MTKESEETENFAIVLLAALFRASAIANGKENTFPNVAAISEAERFINACKSKGIWPRDLRKL